MRFISPFAHSIIGFTAGIVLLLTPNIFGFSDVATATAVPRIIGVIVILSELSVRGSFSSFGFIPMGFHIVTDVIMGAFLAISPWLFGFYSSSRPNVWLPHVIVGLFMIAYALLTRTNDEREPLRA